MMNFTMQQAQDFIQAHEEQFPFFEFSLIKSDTSGGVTHWLIQVWYRNRVVKMFGKEWEWDQFVEMCERVSTATEATYADNA